MMKGKQAADADLPPLFVVPSGEGTIDVGWMPRSSRDVIRQLPLRVSKLAAPALPVAGRGRLQNSKADQATHPAPAHQADAPLVAKRHALRRPVGPPLSPQLRGGSGLRHTRPHAPQHRDEFNPGWTPVV